MNDQHDNEKDDAAMRDRLAADPAAQLGIYAGHAAISLPDLMQIINLSSWAESLVNGAPYDEPDPTYLQRALLMQTLTAKSAEEVLNANGIRKLQESIPDLADSSTGPIEITDLYVTGSDFGEGLPTYVIFGGTDLEMRREVRYSTGATQVQASFLALLNLGVWPIRCQIKRLSRKDKGGRHLFWVTTPD